MKSIARSLIVVLVALIAVPALVVTATITTAVQLLATTVLILGGTGHTLGTGDDPSYVNPYLGYAVNNYIDPGPANTSNYTVYAVTYPAEFFPVSGSKTFDESVSDGVDNLGQCLATQGDTCGTSTDFGTSGNPAPSPPDEPPYIVFGYSQSAVVASLVKNDMIEHPGNYPGSNGTEFYLISNPMRPNGGILGRGFEGMTIPIIGITFYGPTENSCAESCTGDNYVLPTTDVAQQYDLLGGDAPAVVWNVLAWGNSAAAYYYLHGDVPSHSLNEAISEGTFGDTNYYLLPSERLPILLPLQQVGVPDALLAVADAPLRVLIESAYYRDTSPGQSVGFQLLPQKDLGTLAVNLVASIPVGIDDGLQEVGVGRALGTNDVDRPFGVGGETYEKGTGAPAGVETGGNVVTDPVAPNTIATQSQTQPLRIAGGPVGGDVQPEVNKDSQTEQSGNVVTQQTDATPVVTRPRPLQIVRDSLNFDPSKRPAATPPSGNGPLRQIVKALTGQKPNTTTSTEANNESNPAA
jgi:hypothetical protein